MLRKTVLNSRSIRDQRNLLLFLSLHWIGFPSSLEVPSKKTSLMINCELYVHPQPVSFFSFHKVRSLCCISPYPLVLLKPLERSCISFFHISTPFSLHFALISEVKIFVTIKGGTHVYGIEIFFFMYKNWGNRRKTPYLNDHKILDLSILYGRV